MQKSVRLCLDEDGDVTPHNLNQRDIGGYNVFACGPDFFDEVAMPEDVERFYAVFTDKPRADSFEIGPNGNLVSEHFHYPSFCGGAKYLCLRQRKAGMRYVHVEYEL